MITFPVRNLDSAISAVADNPDGTIVSLAGMFYKVDSNATGPDSDTYDIKLPNGNGEDGVDGLVQYGHGTFHWADEFEENVKYGNGQIAAWIWGPGAGKGVKVGSGKGDGIFAWGAGVLGESNGVKDFIGIGAGVASHGDPGKSNILLGTGTGARLEKPTGATGDEASRNVLIGSLSGHFLTEGARNVAIGRNTIHGLETGEKNTTVGTGSLSVGLNPTVDLRIEHLGPKFNCSYNSNLGAGGLRLCDSDYNTNVGWNGLEHVKTKGKHTAVGTENYMHLDENVDSPTVSYRNTAIGYRGGYGLNTGSDNVHIGPAAGNHQGPTYNSMLVIDNGYQGRTSEATIVANFENNHVGIGGNVAKVSTQSEKFAVYNNNKMLFGVNEDGTSYHNTSTQVAKHTFYGPSGSGVSAAIGIVDNNENQATIGLTNGGTLQIKSENGEVAAVDKDNNVTPISPHKFDLIPNGPSEEMAWAFYSEREGKVINVDMLEVIRTIEELSGKKLVHTKGC